MDYINLSEAKAHLGRYIQRVRKGHRVVIAERNTPVAELRSLRGLGPARKVRLGVVPEWPELPDDFNAPLDEFEEDFYGT